MNIQVVVAHYKEDLSWVQRLPFHKIIYTKSDFVDNIPVQHRPNIGREAETWLYHIIQHYHDLADLTVFLQGNPFDHMNMKTASELVDYIQSSSRQTVTLLAANTHMHTEHHLVYGNLPINKSFENMFAAPVPSVYVFAAGAQYIVSRDIIRSRPLEFYQHLHEQLMRETTQHYTKVKYEPGKIDAWTLERLWTYIWDPKIPLRTNHQE